MNIKDATKHIKNTITAYLEKEENGEFTIPVNKQRPVFLYGPPGIGKTAVMEVKDEFSITVHAIVTAEDIHEYLQGKPEYENVLKLMEDYMAKYCVF